MLPEYYLNYLISGFIIIPLIIGLSKFKRMEIIYRPYIFYLLIAALELIFSLISNELFGTNITVVNIYYLIESLILLRLYQKWGVLSFKKQLVLSGIFFFIWVTEKSLKPITFVNSVFLIIYSLTMVVISIENINRIHIFNNERIRKNSKFLVSLTLVFYFTLNAAFEIFLLNPPKFSFDFQSKILDIYRNYGQLMIIANTFSTLWIPEKRNYISMC